MDIKITKANNISNLATKERNNWELNKNDQIKNNYRATPQEKLYVDYIRNRFQGMQANRRAIDSDWQTYQAMIEAIFEPYPDERSSSTVPLISSMAELYVADARKLKTEWNFKSEIEEYKQQSKALEYVWKYDWRVNKRNKVFNRDDYLCAMYGTSIIYSGFEMMKSIIEDPEMDHETGEFKFTKKLKEKNQIISKNVDIRHFYIDDNAIYDFDDANDCIYIQYVPYEDFVRLSMDKKYKNIEYAQPVAFNDSDFDFYTEAELSKVGKFVKLTHYWNLQKDRYVVLANNSIVIREHPIISTKNGEKCLPFTVRPFGYKPYSIYGRGFCEAGMMFNSEINNLRELLMDAIRRSNTQVLALGNWLTFNGRDFTYDNEILTFDGDMAGNFQQISGNAPNQAIFSYLTQIYKDIAVYVGIDIQNIIGEPSQTAFQTEVQREASQKRINVWIENRDLAYERFADIHKDLLQKYFPLKQVKELYIEGARPEGELPKLEIEWEEFRDNKFRKKKGKYMFEVTPEMLRGDIYVDVFTNTTAPTIAAVDRAQKLDLVNSLASITQGYAVAQQAGGNLEDILPLKELLTELAEDYNISVTSGWSDADEVMDAKKQLEQELLNRKQTLTNNPLQAWQEEVVEEETETISA